MRPHPYRISVAGHLGPCGQEAFAGMEIVCVNGRTDLCGMLDQAAMFGLIAQVQRLALELLDVHREDRPAPEVAELLSEDFTELVHKP